MGRRRYIINLLIGLGLIGVIFYKLDVEEMFYYLREIKLSFVFFSLLSYLFACMIISSRIKILLESLDENLDRSSSFFIHMSGMLLSDFTPGRVGYTYIALPLKVRGISIVKSLTCVTLCQLSTFLVRFLIGICFLVFIYWKLRESFFSNILMISLGLIAILIIFIVFLSYNRSVYKILSYLPIGSVLIKNFGTFQSYCKTSLNVILELLAVTMLSFILMSFRWYFLGNGLGIEINYFYFLFLHIVYIITFFPFSPAGVGFTEGGIIAYFALFGVAPELAFIFGLLDRFIQITIDILGLKGILNVEGLEYIKESIFGKD